MSGQPVRVMLEAQLTSAERDRLCAYAMRLFPRLSGMAEDLVHSAVEEMLRRGWGTHGSQKIEAQGLQALRPQLRKLIRWRAVDVLRTVERRALEELEGGSTSDSEGFCADPVDHRQLSPSALYDEKARRREQALLLSDVLREFTAWCESSQRRGGPLMKRLANGRPRPAATARVIVWCVAIGLKTSLLAAGAMAGGALDDASENAATLPPVHKIVATVHDLRHDEATERALDESLRSQVLQTARQWSGLPISEGQIVSEMLWLARQEGVRQTRSESVDPLSGRVTLKAELTVPLEVVERWRPQLRERYLRRYRALLAGWSATAGLWLPTVVAAVAGDWLRGGYRRSWLIPGAVGTAAGLTAAGWWYLYAAVLAAPYAG